MKRFFMWFLKPWVLSLLGVALLSLVLWFEGPLLSFNGHEPFATASVRCKSIAVLFLLWAGWFIWKYCAARWANRKLMKTLAGDEQPGVRESGQEIALLGQRMQEALAILRKTGKRRGGQYLYQLPWYMFVGAPGSGKTTALVHSGLKFPVADALGPTAIGGVGGTRNCDWWFSDEAVLLDTAGRYTTQDSHAHVDQAAWGGFLALLKKHRKRRPINGVIVALSVADLLQQGAAGRALQAQAIRARIKELHEQLGIGFPIYVVVTKCDLLAGFVEFFEPLGREERMQVWGMTFPTAQADSVDQVLAGFPEEFAALERQLQVRVLARMQQERDLQRRALLYRFPQQFAGIGQVLGDFLNEVFAPTRYEEPALLRGVYFSSGTQEGSPIDRVMASLAGAFGLDRKMLPSNAASGRSYFLTTLMREVVFKEAELAGSNVQVERRRRRLQTAGYVAIGLLLVLMLGALTTSYLRNQDYVETVRVQVALVEKLAHGVPAQASLPELLPLLNAARQLTGVYDEQRSAVPLLSRFGLSQADKLGSGAQVLYQRLLRETLLPRVVSRLEEALRRGDANNQEYLYATLRVYLMLGDRRYLDPESILAWLEIDWPRSLAPATQAQVQQLLGHAGALLRDGDDSALPPTLDSALIAQTRLTLAMMPMPQRAYNRLKRDLEQGGLPEFSVNGAVGRDVSQLLAQQSGAPLTRGVPGIFSVEGFRGLEQQIGSAIGDISKDSWVLDRQESAGATADAALKSAVLQLYYVDYIKAWDTFLADVRIVPFSSLDQAARVTNALAAADSPLLLFLQAAARETTLDGLKNQKSPLQGLDDVVQSKLATARKKLEAAMSSNDETPEEAPVSANPVDLHFDALHKMVGLPGAAGPVPAEQLLSTLKDASQYFDAADDARRAGTPPPAADVMTRLKREAEGKPAPLGGMLQNIDSGAGALTLGSERARLNALWTSSAAGFCQQAIAGRYPLVRAASKDVTSDDFGKFFAPGGLMDDFFSKNLAPYVDMGGAQWPWRATGSAPLGIPEDVLKQFQLAARIRDMLFSPGAARPGLRFDLTPLNIDAALSQVQLEIDGQPVVYVADMLSRATSIQLPSGKGGGQVRFEATPALRTDNSTDGPWAWFRMMDKGTLQTTAQGERYRLTFDLDGRKATYQLDASSVINPFRRNELQQFRCPVKL
ncbi:MAG TPA: type VI secretion system membrane subunit TssM [Pseudomonas sp.]